MNEKFKIPVEMPRLRSRLVQSAALIALLLANASAANCQRLKRPADDPAQPRPVLKIQTAELHPVPKGKIKDPFDLRLRKTVADDGSSVLESGTSNNNVPNLTVRLEGGVTQTELEKLSKYDLKLLLDRSFSMTGLDCPPFSGFRPSGRRVGISRWDWCKEQTKPLATLTGRIRNKGLTITTFYNTFKTFENVTLGQVERLYAEQAPNQEVGTVLNLALRDALDSYFARRDAAGRQNPVDPLAIAIITDGRVHRTSDIEDTLLNATKRMRRPDEVRVTLLFVGENSAPKKSRGMLYLDETLRRNGARYDIVKIVPFPVLERMGLSKSLIQALP